MATAVIMPRQGQSVESCIIAKWNKKVSDKVSVGDVLFTYETDKATFEEEAKLEGTMLAIFFEEGDDVPCLTNVCVIGNEGEATSEFNPNAATSSESSEKTEQVKIEAKEEKTEIAKQVTLQKRDDDDILKISPRAKNLANKSGVDLSYASASGPNGRIIEKDVVSLVDNKVFATPAAKAEFAGSGITQGTGIGGRVTTYDLASKPSASMSLQEENEFEEVPLPNIRKVIAKAMHNSLSTMAQLTLNSSFNATDIMEFRNKLKNAKDRLSLSNITINDIILYAVSRTLLSHKECNAHFYDDKMVFFKNAHIGVAVDTPRGLLVPTVFNANKMSLNELSLYTKAVVEDSQKGTISPDMLKGGTFTVTNLGTLGIESFTPVINPPQTCILGVNTIVNKVYEVNGEIKTYPSMGLSLTFDHRALDGAPAARFLKDLITNLENFSSLLVL